MCKYMDTRYATVTGHTLIPCKHPDARFKTCLYVEDENMCPLLIIDEVKNWIEDIDNSYVWKFDETIDFQMCDMMALEAIIKGE